MAKRMTTTVSSKRQITLPAELCRDMGIEPGTKLDVIRVGPTITLRRAEMTAEEFEELLDAATIPEPLPMPADVYIRRIRDGGDLDKL